VEIDTPSAAAVRDADSMPAELTNPADLGEPGSHVGRLFCQGAPGMDIDNQSLPC
jgi:hypothetical protein